MKKLTLAIFVCLLSTSAFADLGDYPQMFIDQGSIDVTIITSSSLGAVGVVAANSLQASLSEYMTDTNSIVSLDSEASLGSNAILLGNPCDNTLTKELLYSGEDCSIIATPDKAIIRYIELDGVHYILIMGYDAPATREAVNFMIGNVDELLGTEMEYRTTVTQSEAKKSEEKQTPSPVKIETDIEPSATKSSTNGDTKPTATPIPSSSAHIIVKQDKGIIARFLDWIARLFS